MSKKKTALVAVLALLGFAAVGLMAGVYAKYIASIDGKSASATVAKWSFKEDNATTTLTCPLEKTYKPSTLVAGKIAPGTKGTCIIELSNKNSEVGVNYTVKISKLSGPANLVFTKDSEPIASNHEITGTLKPGEELKYGNSIKIDWEWPYETTNGDDADTLDGRTAADHTTEGTDKMEVTFEISGYQVQPE
ncbi:hypothetical protein IJM16_01220 [Candidatus Saccharibacteria bacterium]|nr:hypothetical protein [Candidatus Saccharibacteria bacterium]